MKNIKDHERITCLNIANGYYESFQLLGRRDLSTITTQSTPASVISWFQGELEICRLLHCHEFDPHFVKRASEIVRLRIFAEFPDLW